MPLDYEPKTIVADLIDNNWNLSTTPEVTVTDNDNKKVKSTIEPLEIRINQLNPVIERADILYQTEDVRIPVVIQIEAHNDDATEYWSETRRILSNNRTKGRGLGGEWDRIEFDDNELTDPQFSEHTALIQVEFIRHNRPY